MAADCNWISKHWDQLKCVCVWTQEPFDMVNYFGEILCSYIEWTSLSMVFEQTWSLNVQKNRRVCTIYLVSVYVSISNGNDGNTQDRASVTTVFELCFRLPKCSHIWINNIMYDYFLSNFFYVLVHLYSTNVLFRYILVSEYMAVCLLIMENGNMAL